jgi:radical SAM superfamily enzyme with C-terminal helix-hairpin-helix motif
MASLESELSSLGLVADRMGWLKWAGCEEIVSASDFVNLSGEGEVFAEFNVEEIVELVLTEGQDKPDSDEDKHDEPHIVKEYAWKLQEFVEYHPDTFPPHLVSAVNDIRGKLNAMQLTGLRQASIIHLFQA